MVAIEIFGNFVNINSTAVNNFVPFSFVCTSDYFLRTDSKSATTRSKARTFSEFFFFFGQILFHVVCIFFVFFFQDENGFFP